MFEKEKYTKIQIRLKEKDKQKLQEEAEKRGLTMTDLIKRAVKIYIESEEY